MIVRQGKVYVDLEKLRERNEPLKKLVLEQINYMLLSYGFHKNKETYYKNNLELKVNVKLRIISRK